MTEIKLTLPDTSYTITIGQGILRDARKYMDLDRRVFIITDSGVPKEYAKRIAECCRYSTIYTVDEGESAKSPEVLEGVLSAMLDYGITRTDCAIAVGGGVVGDLTGFAAAIYMRGIDFYNVPTTLLSQVDSSIGGKTAINLRGVKNIVGAFHQPRAVLIDTDTLKTLDDRQYSAGLAESVKMAATFDKELFEFFENNDINESNIEHVIARSLEIKRYVVEQDERESGLRKVLNFGHTLGHGIEAECELTGMYHGECVALGMLPVSSDNVRERLLTVLKRLGLPTEYKGNIGAALDTVRYDKKCEGKDISVILCDEIGSYRIEKMSVIDFEDLVTEKMG